MSRVRGGRAEAAAAIWDRRARERAEAHGTGPKRPGALRRLFEATGRAAGRLLGWLMLVPLFYLFFLPFGRLLRRGRRDRLCRGFDREAQSYWEPHAGPTAGSGSMERQY